MNPVTAAIADTQILSEDHAGNLVRDDFGGNHYRFTTNRRGPFDSGLMAR